MHYLHRTVFHFVLLPALVGCETKTAADSSTRKSLCGDEVLGEEGIGELRIGAAVASVRQKCNVIRDTTAMGAEGMPARKLAVALSRDTVEAEIVNGRVWRVAVNSPRLRTADGLGAGTSIESLRQLKSARLMTGEGQHFVASPDHCGMSFRLSNAGPDALRGNLDRPGLSRLPVSAVVAEVLIFGCHLTPAPRAQ